jgi:iron complex transport system substrate-binding protein
VKKPEQQWETRLHRAYRKADVPGPRWGARAEAFELRFVDGRVGEVVCGLGRQQADAVAACDPDLEDAVKAWLIARGARSIDLRRLDDTPLAAGPITPLDLSDPVPSQSPRRLITLCPSNAEMVGALGSFDRVVACEDSSDWPDAVAACERLGPDLGPDLDRVAALEPDLVLSSLSVPGMERNVTGLRARGIPQLVLAPRSLGDVLAEIDLCGRYLHVESEAAALREWMRGEIAELEAARGEPPLPVYLEWWPKPMFTPGRDCYSNELIRLAGGTNVFEDRPGSSLEVGADDVVAAAPEVCFVSWCGVAKDKLDPQRLIDRPGLEALAAARAGRVFPLDEAFSGRPGPRMLTASRIMADAIRRVRAQVE